MYLKLLLVINIVSIIELNSFADCCSCYSKPPEEHYCSSDFVALIIARSRIADKDYHKLVYYDFDLWRIYRTRNNASNEALIKRKLYTQKHDSLCGIDLSLGQPYVISGHVIGRKARISVCDYHELWNDMSIEQENSFISGYKNSCAI
jgi:hypothetical protein